MMSDVLKCDNCGWGFTLDSVLDQCNFELEHFMEEFSVSICYPCWIRHDIRVIMVEKRNEWNRL